MSATIKCRRLHVWDGSARAGQPVGPVLVGEVFARVAADGPRSEPAVRFPDGSWEFIWNVEVQSET